MHFSVDAFQDQIANKCMTSMTQSIERQLLYHTVTFIAAVSCDSRFIINYFTLFLQVFTPSCYYCNIIYFHSCQCVPWRRHSHFHCSDSYWQVSVLVCWNGGMRHCRAWQEVVVSYVLPHYFFPVLPNTLFFFCWTGVSFEFLWRVKESLGVVSVTYSGMWIVISPIFYVCAWFVSVVYFLSDSWRECLIFPKVQKTKHFLTSFIQFKCNPVKMCCFLCCFCMCKALVCFL